DQPEIGLVHQGRRLQRVSGAFASQICRRPPPKLPIDHFHNAVSRFDVTLTPSLEQRAHVNPCVVDPVHGRLPRRILPLSLTVSKFPRISRVSRQTDSGPTDEAPSELGTRSSRCKQGLTRVRGLECGNGCRRCLPLERCCCLARLTLK